MPYELTIDRKSGYLHARVTGENSPQTVRGYMGELRAACERHGCFDILIEEHLTGPGLGAFDIFEVVDRGSRPASQVLGRIAMVDTNPEHESRLMKFAETVAVNRGVNLRVFAGVAEALKWLSGPPSAPK